MTEASHFNTVLVSFLPSFLVTDPELFQGGKVFWNGQSTVEPEGACMLCWVWQECKVLNILYPHHFFRVKLQQK